MSPRREQVPGSLEVKCTNRNEHGASKIALVLSVRTSAGYVWPFLLKLRR